jgi:AcrR family transcriptional regulator
MAVEKVFRVGPVRVRVSATGEEPKERLSRDRIVDVALAQMREKGYEAVSMRSIAKELDTGPASLYAHVANKDELDQLLIDRIATLVEVPEPDPGRWAEQVKEVLRANLAAYRAHPGSAQAALATIPTAEGGLRAAEGVMQLLLAGGVRPQLAAWFCDLAALYVSAIAAEESIWVQRGKAAAAAGRPYTEEDVVAQVRQVFAALPPAAYPALTRYAGEMTTGDGDDRFEFGLEVLLAGLVAVSDRS